MGILCRLLPGDIICQNPSDQGQYIFRYSEDAFKEGQKWMQIPFKNKWCKAARFQRDYIEDPSNPGVYPDNGSVRPAKITTQNVTGMASYGGPTLHYRWGYRMGL